MSKSTDLYVLIAADGSLSAAPRPANSETGYSLAELYAILNVDIVEVVVCPAAPHMRLVVDEEGWLRAGAVPNPRASMMCGRPLTGPALYCPASAIK